MSKVQKSHYTAHVKRAERNTQKVQRNTLCVAFWERKSEAKGSNQVSIMFKLTYNGKVKTWATGVICKRGKLNKEAVKIEGDPVASLILQDLKHKAMATYAEMKLTGRPISLTAVWQVVNGHTLNLNPPSVAGCLQLFYEQLQIQVQTGEVTKSVTNKGRSWNGRITEYVTRHYSTNAQLDDIVPADAKRFLSWLKLTHKFSHDYAEKVVQHFKRVLNYAVENEWIMRNPFLNYRIKRTKKMGEILTEKEMQLITNFNLFAPALDHIRHAFLFQCYTGLSYAELVRVTLNDILKDEKTGKEFIKIERQKTGVPSLVPIHPEAQRIINLFDEHPLRKTQGLLVPILSNQKYNNYLKQLAGVCGITKRITSHVARRTAATYYLNKGMSDVSVSAMLGHTNTAMTRKHYAVTRPERVIRDFNNAINPTRKAQ